METLPQTIPNGPQVHLMDGSRVQGQIVTKKVVDIVRNYFEQGLSFVWHVKLHANKFLLDFSPT